MCDDCSKVLPPVSLPEATRDVVDVAQGVGEQLACTCTGDGEWCFSHRLLIYTQRWHDSARHAADPVPPWSGEKGVGVRGLVGKTVEAIQHAFAGGAGEFPEGEVLVLFFTDGDVLQIDIDVNKAALEAAQARTPPHLRLSRCHLRTHFIIRRWRNDPPVVEVPAAFREAFNSDETTE